MNNEIEVVVYRTKKLQDGDLRIGSLLDTLTLIGPEVLAFLCLSEYFRIGKDVKGAKLDSFKGFNIGDFIRRMSEKIESDNYLILLAKFNGRLVGQLIAWLDDMGVSEPMVDSLYVENEYRGKGVGTALLEKLIEEVDKFLKEYTHFERQYKSIRANIFNYNGFAIHLFKKFGFTKSTKDKFSNKVSVYRKVYELNKEKIRAELHKSLSKEGLTRDYIRGELRRVIIENYNISHKGINNLMLVMDCVIGSNSMVAESEDVVFNTDNLINDFMLYMDAKLGDSEALKALRKRYRDVAEIDKKMNEIGGI